MKKLTLEQCNALPISELYMATIVEPLSSENIQEISNEDTRKLLLNAKETFKGTITNLVSEFDTSELEDQIDALAGMKLGIAGIFQGIAFTRATVVYKMPDGLYLDLNGHDNQVYSSIMVKLVEPFADYYEEGTFRFMDNPEEVDGSVDLDDPTCKGIFIDVDSKDGFDRYIAKKEAYFKQMKMTSE